MRDKVEPMAGAGDMKLYFSRNPNPRLAVAVARHLMAEVTFEFASPFAPAKSQTHPIAAHPRLPRAPAAIRRG